MSYNILKTRETNGALLNSQDRNIVLDLTHHRINLNKIKFNKVCKILIPITGSPNYFLKKNTHQITVTKRHLIETKFDRNDI